MENTLEQSNDQAHIDTRMGAVNAIPLRGEVIRDICEKLNRPDARIEITRAARGDKPAYNQGTTFHERLTPHEYQSAVSETRHVAFLAGVTGEIKGRRSADANVPHRHHVIFDCDFKETFGETFLGLPPNEKRKQVIDFWFDNADGIIDALGEPWMVVYSGKGIHLHYWSSVAIATDDNYRAFYSRVCHTLATTTGMKWDDACANPSRMIRMPYSTNYFRDQVLPTLVIHHNPSADNADLFAGMIANVARITDKRDAKKADDVARREIVSKAMSEATGAVSHTDNKSTYFLKERVKRDLTFTRILLAYAFEPAKKNERMIRAPWRNDDTASVSLDHERKIFKDFGSEKHKGDILDFLGFVMGIESPRFAIKPIVEEGARILGYGDFDARQPDYFLFFKQELGEVRRDLVSDVVHHKVAGKWEASANHIDALRARAIDTRYLDQSHVRFHFADYGFQLKPRLLVDIPEWDGIDRVKQIAQCLYARNHTHDEIEEILKEWGAKLFERIDDTRIQNPMIILTGDQGMGKGDLVNAMVGALGDTYFGQGSLGAKDDKDDDAKLTSSLVWFVDEFDTTKKIPIPRLKEIITRSNATFRAPYAAATRTIPCRYSMIGACNHRDVLRDATGNRRFRVIELTSIQWNYPTDQSAQVLAQFKSMRGYTVSDRTREAIRRFALANTPESLESQIVREFDAYLIAARTTRLEGHEATHMKQTLMRLLGTSERKITAVLKEAGRCKLHRNTVNRYALPHDM